jgi:nitrogen fixation/metabolism regulation signal transduction histidine kinase
MREVTLNAGLKGLNLSVIFHEVEREIVALNKAIHQGEPDQMLAKRSEQIVKLLEGFQPLLRRNEITTFDISKLLSAFATQIENRLKYHRIVMSVPVLTRENKDFQVTAPYGLVLASLQNLIENSIHWTRLRAEKAKGSVTPAIGIFTLVDWFDEGPALVVADNGPGFSLSPEEAVAPFVTDRPGGAGLGLYYVNMVMENIGGRLLILSPDELELPKPYNGAAVVLLFKRGNN